MAPGKLWSFVQLGSSTERGRMSERTISLALSKPSVALGNQSVECSGKRHLQLLCFKFLLLSEKFSVTRPTSFQITYPEVTYSPERCRTSTSLLSCPQATCSAECTRKPVHVGKKDPESQDTGGDRSSGTVLDYYLHSWVLQDTCICPLPYKQITRETTLACP